MTSDRHRIGRVASIIQYSVRAGSARWVMYANCKHCLKGDRADAYGGLTNRPTAAGAPLIRPIHSTRFLCIQFCYEWFTASAPQISITPPYPLSHCGHQCSRNTKPRAPLCRDRAKEGVI